MCQYGLCAVCQSAFWGGGTCEGLPPLLMSARFPFLFTHEKRQPA
nr:MAG TPA: hypothetical protein [Caudoviricetes sp.]